jgi:tripartite-type tricarboxylate transporter receptor subunit TctC
VLGGHVTLLATGADEVLQFYKTRQMRFLAVMNEQRHPAFPDAPTLAEAGFGLDQLILDWRGLGAPKGTPAEVTQTLRAGFLKMAEDPDFIRLMDELALPRSLLEGDKFGEFLAGMEKTMEPALKEANLLKKE